MKIAVLGTGVVGKAIGTRLIQLGHEVKMGSRTANNEKAQAWVDSTGGKGSHGTFSDASAFGEILFNCTNGNGSLEALKLAGENNLKGKILVDISNPLDFSKGMPPTLFVCNDNSLGEQIQTAFPALRVVKTLNTINCNLMVNPQSIHNGDHNVFLSGNDKPAKDEVKSMLRSFGWKDEFMVDLGDITTSRGVEQYLALWIRMFGTFGNVNFNMQIVKG